MILEFIVVIIVFIIMFFSRARMREDVAISPVIIGSGCADIRESSQSTACDIIAQQSAPTVEPVHDKDVQNKRAHRKVTFSERAHVRLINVNDGEIVQQYTRAT